MPDNFNLTTNTWSQVANKQAYEEVVPSNLNSETLMTKYDPIYNKLVQQISYTIYHKIQVAQRWKNIGTTLAPKTYPGMLRELIMTQRKGQNFPMDAGERPTTLLNYSIIDDEIDTRYHSCQVRWMYGYTIFDEELRRFSGGNGTTITQLTEMKSINSMTARNLFMDNLRKAVMNIAAKEVGKVVETNIDIKNYDALTPEQARSWLNMMDNLLYSMYIGSTEYNKLAQYMQVPKSRLQLVIPRNWYLNVVRKAYPDMYNRDVFDNIFPENVVFIDTLGNDKLVDASGNDIAVTFTENGQNTTSYQAGNQVVPADPNLQCIIMDKGIIGFEDNLSEVLVGTKDIEKLATPVRCHYWTSAYYTDLLPMACVKYAAPATVATTGK